MRATLVSSDSFSTTPASADTRGAANRNETRRKEAVVEYVKIARFSERAEIRLVVRNENPWTLVRCSPSTYDPPEILDSARKQRSLCLQLWVRAIEPVIG